MLKMCKKTEKTFKRVKNIAKIELAKKIFIVIIKNVERPKNIPQ